MRHWIATFHRRDALGTAFALIGFLFISLAACAQTERGTNTVTDQHVQEMAALTGQDYLARRNAFLTSAPPLSEVRFDPTESDPYYSVQYRILRGWQQNSVLYRQMMDRLESVNVQFMERSAAGFNGFHNETRSLSAREWRYDGLAFAWEDITKFADVKPRWQIYNSVEIIIGFPHVDSIDPLLIAALQATDPSTRETFQIALSKMPGDGLQQRLRLDTDFYQRARPFLQEALRRQQ